MKGRGSVLLTDTKQNDWLWQAAFDFDRNEHCARLPFRVLRLWAMVLPDDLLEAKAGLSLLLHG
jgi:hypothetical protein